MMGADNVVVRVLPGPEPLTGTAAAIFSQLQTKNQSLDFIMKTRGCGYVYDYG